MSFVFTKTPDFLYLDPLGKIIPMDEVRSGSGTQLTTSSLLKLFFFLACCSVFSLSAFVSLITSQNPFLVFISPLIINASVHYGFILGPILNLQFIPNIYFTFPHGFLYLSPWLPLVTMYLFISDS